MPKKNPWSLARPKSAPSTRTFTDPDYPGEEWTLTARKLNGCEMMLAIEDAEKTIDLFIKQGNVYPQAGGQVRLSEALLRGAHLLEAMQRGEDGEPYAPEDFYTVDDLIGLAHLSAGLWMTISEWTMTFAQKEPPEGNSAGAGETSSSALP